MLTKKGTKTSIVSIADFRRGPGGGDVSPQREVRALFRLLSANDQQLLLDCARTLHRLPDPRLTKLFRSCVNLADEQVGPQGGAR